jgi:hypothetical protein
MRRPCLKSCLEYSSRCTSPEPDAEVNIHDFSSYHDTARSKYLVAHGRGAPLAGLLVGSLGLGDALGEDLSVLVLSIVSI